MNVQELLTYVEELTFKTSMFGYDKDEVDIQLDKICDEIEAIVNAKNQEITELKAGGQVAKGKEESIVEVVKEELTGEESETELLNQQLAKMKERLQAAEERAAAAEQQSEEAEERAVEAEKKAASAEGKAAVAASKAAAAQADRGPVTKDEAYEQYLRNADLLCKQLSDLQSRQDVIVEEARTEADKVLSDAKTQAEQMIAEANEKAALIKQEAEEARKELQVRIQEEEKQCEELKTQKVKLAETLKALTEDIKQLVNKVEL